MNHPVVRTESLQPRHICSPGASSVAVVIGHMGNEMLGKEVGWKLTCVYLHACSNNWKTMREAEEYVDCPKAV